MNSRDWLSMTRQDFDVEATEDVLFDLDPAGTVADDGHGTGDLLQELDDA